MHDPRSPSRRLASRFCAALAALTAAFAAPAQVQRTFVNLGFEQPSAGSSVCYFQIGESAVPGWTTTHSSLPGVACAPNIAQTPGPLIEIWANGFNGVTARHGTQFAELNAHEPSRIYQNVCLANGEPIGWRFSHRGRQSTTVSDVMEFRVGSTAGENQVILAATQSDGGIDPLTCYNTGASTTGIANNTCTSAAASGGWRDYSGQFTWNGATGVQAIGFRADSAAGGTSIGNFIDDIQMTLRPFVELTTAQATVREGSSDALPALRVVGTVPTGGISVTLTINGGTAVRGSDYTTASGTATLSVSVPAGVYDGTNFALPLTLTDDAAIENHETITLAITSSPTNYVLSSTQTCGAAPITATTIDLVDNDVDLVGALTASASSALGGESLTYTLNYTNNTAKPTTGSATAHDAVAPIALAQPAGITFTSWTCTATDGASCPGGTVNGTTTGSGAISGNATLPAGNGAAGGRVSYAINAAIDPSRCTNTTASATIAPPAGFSEGTSVQAGFTSPTPGGNTDNTATHALGLSCLAALSLTKDDGQTIYTAGGSTTYTIDLTNAGPSHATGVTLTDTLPTGLTLSAAPICTTTGTATCGTLTGTSGGGAVTLTGASVARGAGNRVRVTVPVNYAGNLTAASVTNLVTASGTAAPAVSASDTNTSANQAPVANAASTAVSSGNTRAIVLAGSDADNDPLTFRVTTPPTHGTLTGTAPNLTYTPDTGYVGSDTFAFVANDGKVDSAPATVTITVRGANHAPQITTTPVVRGTQEATYAYDVDATDQDAGDVVSYALAAPVAGLAIDATSGAISGLPTGIPVDGLETPNPVCRMPYPERGLMDPAVAWSWQGSVYAPTFKQVVSIPLVAQTNDDNGDGVIDKRDHVDVIVTTGYFNTTNERVSPAILRVLDGRTGEELAHTSVDEAIDNFATPAVGDIDGDGDVEIVVLTWDWKLAAFSHDLQLLWKTAGAVDPGSYGRGPIALADLDGDGTVEILTSGKVFTSTGVLKFALSGGIGMNFYHYGGIMSVADLDGDGKQEIIGGGTVYRHDGTVLWTSTAFSDGYTAVGDVVGDAEPEIVLVYAGRVTLLNRHGATLWGPVTMPDVRFGGAPTLADMDGDGRPEIGIATQRDYRVYKGDGSLLWSREVFDNSSGVTGSSVFDFDGDGRAEVLAMDHERWRIYRGNDGHVLVERGNSTGTQFEYPVVADVDGEPGAEILIVENDYLQQMGQDTDTHGGTGLTVWRSATGSWQPTRALWNQYAYHIDNVNDDGTIPALPVRSWLTHNTYRLNAFPDGRLPPLPDLAPFAATLTRDANGAHLTARVRNRGLAAGTATTLRFYAGDPASAGLLLGEAALPALAPNAVHNAVVDIAANVDLGAAVYARIETTERECDATNNVAAAAVVRVRASDLDGASDTQTYTLSIAPVNHAPTIPTQTLPPVELDRAYATRLVASDADRGDALRYTLLEGPDKLVLDEVSGAIRWTALPTQLGTHPLRVRIADLAGLGEELSLTLTVVPGPNRAPIVSSEPIVRTYVNENYAYQVQAYDPDSGDRVQDITYAHVAGPAPIGSNGLFWWRPTLADLGDHTVRVRVSDIHGASVIHEFVLSVVQRPNRLPTIQTSAPTSATVGTAYSYDVNATDPDQDTLTYSLPEAPAGMTIDGASGLIAWTPATNQVGTHPVRVKVVDGRGGEAEQSFTITTVPAPNRAPSFTSTPVTGAEVAANYAYTVTASDPDTADTLTWTLVSGPAGLTLDANHVVRWRPTLAQVGSHAVELKVTDNGNPNLSATQTFDILVNVPANNAPPGITSQPSNTATVGEGYAYDVIASDADGDALSYTLQQFPNGMTVNATGEVRWTPASGQLGTHEIELVVADGRGGTATQTWPISVGSSGGGNRTPQITTAPGTNATAGSLYQYDVNATDADGDTLVYSLVQAPAGMTIDTATGLVTWTPAAAGTFAVGVRVDDGNGAGIVQTYALNVRAAGANRLPTIDSAPPSSARVGRVFAYDVAASDADGDALTYTLQQSPAGMTLSATGELRWTPAAIGSEPVTVRVADAHGYVEQIWTITIVGADTPLDVTVTVTPTSVNAGDPIVVRVVTEGAGGSLTATGTLDGQPITVNPNGDTTLTAPTTPGVHTIAVSVSDGVVTTPASADFGVADPADTAAPVVVIASPSDGNEITQPVDVRGTVNDASLQSWVLALRAANTPDAPTTILARGNANVADAIVGKLDPTLLVNDQYVVILQATDTGGRTTSASVVVRVTGEMKVGHYSITLEDVNLPVAGIPIQVTRTYDTRRRNESLDFGHGWSVDYQNVRVRESQRLGYSWRLEMRGGGLNRQACVIPNGPRTVTVTLPDGDVETFEAVATPECHSLNTQVMVAVGFRGVDNTHSTLEQLDYSNLRLTTIAGNPVSVLSDPGSPGEPADPSLYRLTTREGVVYELDQHFGVRRVIDPNGNTLTYSASGIVHSTGLAVAFDRDAQGRIKRIVLPDGTSLRYDIDANGDLVASTDAANQTTRYTYKPRFAHYLENLVDARGIRVQRNEYDADGRLVKSIDADGKAIEFDHAIADRTERVKNRRGYTTTYVYDDQGYVLRETNARNETTHRTYDADGNELTRRDPLNRTTTWTYDIYGNRLTETNALNQTTRSEYGDRNALMKQYSAQYPTRVTMENVYDNRWGQLLTTTDAMGQVTTFTYDRGAQSWETGELRSIRDPALATTQFAVNPLGWQTGTIDATGHITNIVHDTNGRPKTQTTSRTNGTGNSVPLVTTTGYDDKGRVTSTTHPDNSVSTTTYTPIDKPATECDTQNRCTTYEYDSRGNLWKTTYPDATFETKTFDENGNVTSETDRAGRTTRTVFDALDRAVKVIHPDDTPNDPNDNPFSETVYDAAGRVEATIDENDNLTTFAYDDADRRTSVTNAKNETSTTAYDADGRRTSMTDAQNRTTKFVYDDAGKLVETIHPDEGTDDGNDANNPRTFTTYDAAGRKVADTDDAGRITRFAYDKLGRLIAVFLPNPVTGANPVYSGDPPVSSDSGVLVTRYRYDEVGNKKEQEDATGNITAWTYDNAGRMLTRKLPLLQSESFVYDTLGRRTQHTDFRGRITTYAYKPNTNLLATIDYATQTDVAMTYTADGQLDTVVDGNGTTAYERDVRGRLKKVTWPTPSGSAIAPVVSYQYDAVGNRTKLVTNNQTIDYTYDVLNRLATVKPLGATNPIAIYAYTPVGSRESVSYDNGTSTSYTYNRRNRLTGISHKLGATVLLGVAYTLDPSGLRTGIAETGAINRTVTYDYDAVKRLTKESVVQAAGDRRTSWTYDKTGNRLTQVKELGPIGALTGTAATTYDYDANDRLESEVLAITGSVPGATAGTTTYTYDAAGNTTKKVSPTETIDYVYDDANRMVELQTLAGEVTRYAYNHDGIRIRQTRDATGTAKTTHYLIDPNTAYAQVIEESEQTGAAAPTLTALYAFGDDRIRQYRPAQPGNGSQPGTPAGLRYYHADGLGSTRLLTDETGAKTDHYAYEAFGELDAAVSLQASDNDFLYTGEQLDPNSGFYYLRARYMLARNGRFTQQDKWGGEESKPTTLNKYVYADSGAVNGRDPSGLATILDLTNSSGTRSATPLANQRAIQVVSSAEVVDIYAAFEFGGRSDGFPIPHWFVVAEGLGPAGNWRYDYGGEKLYKMLWPSSSNLRMLKYNYLAGAAKQGGPVAKLSIAEWLSWSAIVIGTNRALTEELLANTDHIRGYGPKYCLFTNNCKTMRDSWIAAAILLAKGIDGVKK
jgi:RHS repeat-associated protein/uncharacterized repeat protein (TIGR01451 family)